MTEEEWERISATKLFRVLPRTGPRWQRCHRLAYCGACRLSWDRLAPEARPHIEVVERHVDGELGNDHLRDAYNANANRHLQLMDAERNKAFWLSSFSVAACYLADTVVHPRSAAAARKVLTSAVRDIFRRYFFETLFDSRWRTSTAVGLAQSMYDGRDFAAMPILADALQDAGCEDADILNHCRGDLPHVRGCWVVDLVLGKS